MGVVGNTVVSAILSINSYNSLALVTWNLFFSRYSSSIH